MGWIDVAMVILVIKVNYFFLIICGMNFDRMAWCFYLKKDKKSKGIWYLCFDGGVSIEHENHLRLPYNCRDDFFDAHQILSSMHLYTLDWFYKWERRQRRRGKKERKKTMKKPIQEALQHLPNESREDSRIWCCWSASASPRWRLKDLMLLKTQGFDVVKIRDKETQPNRSKN